MFLLIGWFGTTEMAQHMQHKKHLSLQIGDFGLLLGILGLFWATNNDFNDIATGISQSLSDNSIPFGLLYSYAF